MIDFDKAAVFKLRQCDPSEIVDKVTPLLLEGETVHLAYKGPRDFITFTSKRVIAVNIQGMTGKKRDFTTLPYSKIQAFSVETAGTFDLDSELDLWFSGLGKVRFEFKGNTNVQYLSQLIAHFVL